ncbi:MAG: hypothetical protein QOF18_144 [Frankiaceae bacterium]|nr:hypothetical protein [Frankiaceae bacterium]
MGDEPSVDLRRQTTAANVISGGLWTALANGLAPILLLLQSVVAARFLGPTRMGQQSFIAWVELTASLALSAGAANTLSRYLGAEVAAGRGGEMRAVLRTFTRLQVASGLLPAAVLALVVAPRAPTGLRGAWVLAGVCAALLVAQAVPSTVLVALQQWRKQAVISVVTGVLATAGTVVVLAAGGGITGMFAVEAVALVGSGLWSAREALALVRTMMPRARPAGGLLGEVLRYAGFASVQSTLAYVVWQRSEFFFLDRYSSARQIAMYSIAFATVLGLQRLPESLTQTLVPSLAVLIGAGERERLAVAVSRSLRLLWTASVPLVAGLMAVGPLALRLIYGNDYRASGPVLVILITVLPAVLVARVAGAVLHAAGRVRTVLACLATAVVVDIALCVLLVPAHGARGAAVANIGAQGLATALEVGYARRIVGRLRVSWWRMLAGTLAAAACGGVAYAVTVALPNVAGLVIGIVAGAVAYLVAFLLLRPVADEDLEWLEGIAGARLGGRVGSVLRRLREGFGRVAPS